MSEFMRQISSRYVGCSVIVMEWSNKMDLIAYGTEKGEIIVQRLNGQKIVTFPAVGEDVQVRSLSWQFHKTIIAVGYSNGQVSLLDIENEECISTLNYYNDINKVYFSKDIQAEDYRNHYKNQPEFTHETFLPPLPHLSSMGISTKMKEHKSLSKGFPSFLVIILANSKVHLLLLSALKAGCIDLPIHVVNPTNLQIYDAQFNGDFNAMYAILRDGDQLKVLHFNNSILKEYISPMSRLATYCANIIEMKNYINNTIQCMLEAWETVLLEMDNKLTKYANQQTASSLSANFLELLVFGYASPDIEEFLMHNITEKEIKKVQNSVDLSYTTIQNLVTKPLQNAAINIFYFLTIVKGLSRNLYYFQPLIAYDAAEKAVRQCGSFIMKSLEMQQVINQAIKDMKSFFSWLLVVKLRLHQQDITEDVPQLNNNDTMYLAKYLNSFIDVDGENDDENVNKTKFNLEKVGQYLENRNLTQIMKTDPENLWNKFLEENECLRNSYLLYPHEKQYSLTQQRDQMFESIEHVFEKANQSISSKFQLDSILICNEFVGIEQPNTQFIKCSFLASTSKHRDLIAITIGWQKCLLLEFDCGFQQLSTVTIDLQAASDCQTKFSNNLKNLQFIDLQFYNETTISFLLDSADNDKSQSYFLQCPLDQMQSKYTQHKLPQNLNLNDHSVIQNVYEIVDPNCFHMLDGNCMYLAVSGSRKLASILTDKRKKILIYDLEGDDNEDETEMSENSILSLSKDCSNLSRNTFN